MMTTKELPAVDVTLFNQAFQVWVAARIKAAPEQAFDAGVEALHDIIPEDDVMLFLSVAWRLSRLTEIAFVAHADETAKYQGIPGSWIDIAATAPLNQAEDFAIEHFAWPTGEELKQFEAEAAR